MHHKSFPVWPNKVKKKFLALLPGQFLHSENTQADRQIIIKRHYRIAGMFGAVNVWRIAQLKVIGKIKFGKWIDFGYMVLLPAKIWTVKVWRITHDSPNFPAAKHSCYTA